VELGLSEKRTFFAFDLRLAVARADPSLPPCDLLHDRWAMPAASRLGAISPVSASGGSWSALGPSGCEPGSVMSTGYPHRIQTGSHFSSTCFRHVLYALLERRPVMSCGRPGCGELPRRGSPFAGLGRPLANARVFVVGRIGMGWSGRYRSIRDSR
jgi:hypothetical protein